VDGGTQQPTKSQPKQWDIVGGDGAQGNDGGGGSCCIVLAIEIGGKKIKKTKYAEALCGCKSMNKHNNQPNACGSVNGGIYQDARLAGNAGGAVFDHSGGGHVSFDILLI
jgi:hypothetical protein